MIPTRNLTNDSWRDRLGLDDPERCLLVAVIKFALRDALGRSPTLAADARRYLYGPNFAADCALLELNSNYVLGLLAHQEITMSTIFTDDQIRAIHARYMTEQITLDQLARENATSGATLSRLFHRAGLPIRRRGRAGYNPPHHLAPPAAADDPQPVSLHELNQLLDRLTAAGATPHGIVRLHIDLEIQL